MILCSVVGAIALSKTSLLPPGGGGWCLYPFTWTSPVNGRRYRLVAATPSNELANRIHVMVLPRMPGRRIEDAFGRWFLTTALDNRNLEVAKSGVVAAVEQWLDAESQRSSEQAGLVGGGGPEQE